MMDAAKQISIVPRVIRGRTKNVHLMLNKILTNSEYIVKMLINSQYIDMK